MAITPSTPLLGRPMKADPKLIELQEESVSLQRQAVEQQALKGGAIGDEMLFEQYFSTAVRSGLAPDGQPFTLDGAREVARAMVALHREDFPLPPDPA